MKGSLFLNKTYSSKEKKGLIESILFVNGKSVAVTELAEALDMSKSEIKTTIEEMNQDYNERKSGLNIISVAGGYQFVSNPVYKEELVELFGKRNENQLSKSMIETLAIIAYKQPVSKEDVDKIRGVSSTRSINSLLGYKLITISGATDGIVKTPIYSVTPRFLEMFRINSIDDLPSVDSLDWNDYSDDFDDEEDNNDEENKEKLDNELELTM